MVKASIRALYYYLSAVAVIAFLAITGSSCTKTNENQAMILVEHAMEGGIVRLKMLDTIGPRTIDSLSAPNDGVFRFHLKLKEPAIYFIEDATDKEEMIVSPGDTIKLSRSGNTKTVLQGKDNQEYVKFVRTLESIEQKADSLSQEFIFAQYTDTFASVRVRITDEFEDLRLAARDASVLFMQDNPSSIGIYRAITNSVRQTPAFNFQSDMYWFKFADSCLAEHHPNHRYTLWLKHRINNANRLPGAKRGSVKLQADALDLKSITLPGTGGKPVSIDAKMHELTIVHLWDNSALSRQANAKIKNLYEKYKGNNLGLYSIAFHDNVKGWKAAIELDKMWWNHMIDTAGIKSNILQQLGNPGLPIFIVTEKNYAVSATFTNANDLEKWLADRFRKENKIK